MTQEFVTLPREVAQQALEALEEADLLMEHRQNVELRRSALVTLRAALEQSQGEQAPVAWLWVNKQTGAKGVCFEIPAAFHPDYLWRHLYTQPQPKREPLTDEKIAAATGVKPGTPMWLVAVAFTRAIEAAHNIK